MRQFLVALVLFPAVASLFGAVPGTQVVVVYNSRLPESRAVADYYAQKRQMPANQVLGFALSTNESISRAEFRDRLQSPLAKAIADQKLWRISATGSAANKQAAAYERRPETSIIRYAVLCYGIPLKIARDPDLKEEAAERLRPEMRRNEAAVDSELALLPLWEEKLPLTGPLRNPVYGMTNAAAISPTNGVLLVSRLDGPTPGVARGLVDLALKAEADGLWGRAYFDLRNTTEPGYKLGDDWIRGAAELCQRLGFETVIDANSGTFPSGFPMSQIALYMGWYDENASGPFAEPAVEFMPGAFAYHLHSFSASTLRSAGKGWAGPLLAKGVTATMGAVEEPYLSGTPDLPVFTARFVYAGFSFGEAVYASQPVLSWQITVIGDPLYRPCGRDFDQLQDQLQQRHSPMLPWCYLRLIDLNLANGKPAVQCLQLLEQMKAATHSAVLAEKVADLYSAQGKPSSAAQEYENALKLDPSPMQKLRLRLVLAEKLIGLNRESEAYDTHLGLLKDLPDYPDKLSVHRSLLSLAMKLNRHEEAQKWEAAISAERGGGEGSKR
ncbi:MAG TPA: TIGR03790 family protein [Verrucomicrobiae bacterium]